MCVASAACDDSAFFERGGGLMPPLWGIAAGDIDVGRGQQGVETSQHVSARATEELLPAGVARWTPRIALDVAAADGRYLGRIFLWNKHQSHLGRMVRLHSRQTREASEEQGGDDR